MLQLPIIARMALLLVSLATLLAAAPAVAQENTVVRLEPVALVLQPGETKEVTVWIDSVTGLAGAEVHLTYDPALVEVVDADQDVEGVQVAHGDFLPPDFVAVNQADSEEGTIDYAVALMPPHEPVAGSGPLVMINLQGVAPGETTLAISEVLLADSNGYPIPVAEELSTAVVTVSSNQLFPGICWPWGAVILGTAACVVIAKRR